MKKLLSEHLQEDNRDDPPSGPAGKRDLAGRSQGLAPGKLGGSMADDIPFPDLVAWLAGLKDIPGAEKHPGLVALKMYYQAPPSADELIILKSRRPYDRRRKAARKK